MKVGDNFLPSGGFTIVRAKLSHALLLRSSRTPAGHSLCYLNFFFFLFLSIYINFIFIFCGDWILVDRFPDFFWVCKFTNSFTMNTLFAISDERTCRLLAVTFQQQPTYIKREYLRFVFFSLSAAVFTKTFTLFKGREEMGSFFCSFNHRIYHIFVII